MLPILWLCIPLIHSVTARLAVLDPSGKNHLANTNIERANYIERLPGRLRIVENTGICGQIIESQRYAQ